ncbi:MAG: ABC transporter permease [Spirochaetia bacterium]
MLKRSNILFYIAALFIIIIGVTAAAAPILAPFEPTDQDRSMRYAEPGTEGHILGTDDLGRDILSRIIYGSRSALMVGIVSVGISVTIGIIIGLIAGLVGGLLDNFLMLLMDSILSFPTVLLAITVVSVLGYGLLQVIIAIGIIFSPIFARLVRAETLSIKTEGFVESSVAMGSRTLKTVRLHILPNMLGKLTVQCSIIFALSVVIEASLSYLGLGTQPPNPSWGLMLKDARSYMHTAPWSAVYPGLAIAFTVLSFNILGDSISDIINPISKNETNLE